MAYVTTPFWDDELAGLIKDLREAQRSAGERAHPDLERLIAKLLRKAILTDIKRWANRTIYKFATGNPADWCAAANRQYGRFYREAIGLRGKRGLWQSLDWYFRLALAAYVGPHEKVYLDRYRATLADLVAVVSIAGEAPSEAIGGAYIINEIGPALRELYLLATEMINTPPTGRFVNVDDPCDYAFGGKPLQVFLTHMNPSTYHHGIRASYAPMWPREHA